MSYLSRIHADLRQSRITRRNAGAIDASEQEPSHKHYARMESVTLPDPAPNDTKLTEALIQRISAREFTDAVHSWQMIGSIFGTAARQHANSLRRPYPSGGGLYPIEIYLIDESLETAPSVLHYNPEKHAMDILWKIPVSVQVQDLFRNDVETPATGLIILTSVWSRSLRKYGDFSYILTLLEAGHVSQNFLLAMASLHIPACPLGAFDDERISNLLDINTDEEQIVHAIAF